ncbi:MAG: ribonuclease P protein component [Streptosporangiaceae bacterium]
MLPVEARMRRPADFTLAVRRGSRSGRRTLTGHLLVRAERADHDEPALVGFVVSRAVGNAVTRNKVRRRLRHIARDYMDSLPGGSLLVVRANPPAAAARQSDLAAEFDLVLGTLLRRQVGALHQ